MVFKEAGTDPGGSNPGNEQIIIDEEDGEIVTLTKLDGVDPVTGKIVPIIRLCETRDVINEPKIPSSESKS